MKYCPQCGAQLDDAAVTCTNCGAAQTAVYAPVIPQYDHTAEFSAKDVADNKVMAMVVYLFGVVGVVVAALCSKDSAYVDFHIRQSLKITVVSALIGIVTAVLCWTIIVPIVGGLASLAILIVRVISFVSVCSGKSEEAVVIRNLPFMN